MTYWIDWEGGDRPVSPYTEVEIELNSGEIRKGCACDFDWQHYEDEEVMRNDEEICAYRILDK